MKTSKAFKFSLAVSIVLLVGLSLAGYFYENTPSQKAIACAETFMRNKRSFRYEPSNTADIKSFKVVWDNIEIKNYRYLKIKRGLDSMTNVYTVTFKAALKYKNGKIQTRDVDVRVIVKTNGKCVLYSASHDISQDRV